MAKKPLPRPLSESDWRRVFEIRCMAKRSQMIMTREVEDLLRQALREDPDRYARLSDQVFDATLPFGAQSRRKGTP